MRKLRSLRNQLLNQFQKRSVDDGYLHPRLYILPLAKCKALGGALCAGGTRLARA